MMPTPAGENPHGEDEAVWRALANPHRRRILDLLRQGPRTTGELAGRFDDLSRFAVMQHLGVLEEAGLVLARRRGKQRFNHLNAVPIRRVYERWVNRFAGDAAAAALSLQRFVEEGSRPMNAKPQAVHIENEIRLHAPRERVFHAWTQEQEKWYPYNYGGERLKRIVFEERVGGTTYEDWGEGRGILYGHVAYWDPPKAVAVRSHLRPAINLEQWAVFDEDGAFTVLRYSMTAFGEISDDGLEGIRTHGDLTFVEDKLRAWVERGEAVNA